MSATNPFSQFTTDISLDSEPVRGLIRSMVTEKAKGWPPVLVWDDDEIDSNRFHFYLDVPKECFVSSEWENEFKELPDEFPADWNLPAGSFMSPRGVDMEFLQEFVNEKITQAGWQVCVTEINGLDEVFSAKFGFRGLSDCIRISLVVLTPIFPDVLLEVISPVDLKGVFSEEELVPVLALGTPLME